MPPTTKICRICHRARTLRMFGVDRRESDGLNRACRRCRAARERVLAKDGADAYNAIRRERRAERKLTSAATEGAI
jgi:hypothetical protein